MKLTNPNYNFDESLSKCEEGITGNPLLKKIVQDNKGLLVGKEVEYRSCASSGDLYTLQASNKKDDELVIGQLKKTDLIKLYESYFVPTGKPAREIYDILINSAKEECPFCGGIGTPSNLDHFLPKKYFSQFSVLPYNLIPTCRDCNMGNKGESYAIKPEDQIIHPYLDESHFFNEQWIFARFIQGNNDEPAYFEYFVHPPETWSLVDKTRVKNHFNGFNIKARYAKQAASYFTTIIGQVSQMKKIGLSNDVLNETLFVPGIDLAPFENHWKKGMFQALIIHFSQ